MEINADAVDFFLPMQGCVSGALFACRREAEFEALTLVVRIHLEE